LIVWGAVAGFIYRQENKNIFFDANAWLYFLLIFPVFDVLKKEEDFKNILKDMKQEKLIDLKLVDIGLQNKKELIITYLNRVFGIVSTSPLFQP
jgi:hypothetical protein